MSHHQALNAPDVDQLIKADRWDEARTALRARLKANVRDVEGWYLYAKVAPDLPEACTALENVLALDPDYPQARAALAILKRRMAEGSPKDGSSNPDKTQPDRRDQIETLIGSALLIAALVIGLGVVVFAVTSRVSRQPILPQPDPAAAVSFPVVVEISAEW